MKKVFIEFAESLNPECINLRTRQTELVLNQNPKNYIVSVIDSHTKQTVYVTGTYYQVKKYVSGIEGKHKHGNPQTVNRFVNSLFS